MNKKIGKKIGKKRGMIICDLCGKLTSTSIQYSKNKKKERLCISCAIRRKNIEKKLTVEVTCPNCMQVREISVYEFKKNKEQLFILCDACKEEEKKDRTMSCGREIKKAKSGRCSDWEKCEYSSECLQYIIEKDWEGFRCVN